MSCRWTTLEYMWEDGLSATPQVVVMMREIGAPSEDSPGYSAYGASEKSVVVHKARFMQISDWVTGGALLPSFLKK